MISDRAQPPGSVFSIIKRFLDPEPSRARQVFQGSGCDTRTTVRLGTLSPIGGKVAKERKAAGSCRYSILGWENF